MGCAACLQCTEAHIKYTDLLLTSKMLGMMPQPVPKFRLPRSFPRGQCIRPICGTRCSPAHCLPFLGGSGPTPPAGHLQTAGSSPKEDTGERDVPPQLAITASRKLVLLGSAPLELQQMRLFTALPLACSPWTPVRPVPLYCQR